MIELLEVLGSVVGYIVIGLGWARSQAVRLQKLLNAAMDHRREWTKENGRKAPGPYDRDGWKRFMAADPWFRRGSPNWDASIFRALKAHAALWPGFALARAIAKLSEWTAAPVEKERDEAEKLREQAAGWRKVADDQNTSASDKSLFETIIDTLLDQAKKHDL